MRVEPVLFEDFQAITDLMQRLGMVVPESKASSKRFWAGLWLENPALVHFEGRPELGWKIISNNRLVGFFGNIPQISWIRSQKILVSTARAWVVEREFRWAVPQLCEAFFNRNTIDLVIISSANKPASQRCLEFGGSQMPELSYQEVFYWIVSPSGFSQSLLRKIGAPNKLLRIGKLADLLPLKPLFAAALENQDCQFIEEVPLKSLGRKFDNFWSRIQVDYADRLLATRDSKTLRWYFGLSGNARETKFFGHFEKGILKGYVVVVRDDVSLINLRRLRIADLVVLDENQSAVKKLIAATYCEAKAQGCHILELTGLPPYIREIISTLKPFRRKMQTFPFYFRAVSTDLANQLSQASSWYVTAYDGDSAIY